MNFIAGRYDGGIPDYRGAGSGGRHYARHSMCRICKATVYPQTYSLPSCPSRNARQPGPLIGIPGVLACHVETRQKRAPGLVDGAVQTLLPAYFLQNRIHSVGFRSSTPVFTASRLAGIPGLALGCLRLFSGPYAYLFW